VTVTNFNGTLTIPGTARSFTFHRAGRQGVGATDVAANGLQSGGVDVEVLPAKASVFNLVMVVAPTVAGTANTFDLIVRDPYGNVATNYRETVHFDSSDTQAVLPADYT